MGVGRYVALLRGINVGGNNLIKMTALAACFEKNGFTAVATYIQSGNVIFQSSERAAEALARRIEEMLTAAFRYPASVVLLSWRQLEKVVDEAPAKFGTDPSRYRYDVIYLKPPLTAKEALATVPTNPEVDRVHAGPGVLYFSRLSEKASKSRLSRVVSMPVYRNMTIRNWNTTIKLLERIAAPS